MLFPSSDRAAGLRRTEIGSGVRNCHEVPPDRNFPSIGTSLCSHDSRNVRDSPLPEASSETEIQGTGTKINTSVVGPHSICMS